MDKPLIVDLGCKALVLEILERVRLARETTNFEADEETTITYLCGGCR